MQFQAKRPQPNLTQPPMHHLQRRPLFRHKQNPFPQRQRMRDQVRDRLRFPRPRRSVQHQILPRSRRHDRRQLRRIRAHRTKRFRIRNPLVQLLLPHRFPFLRKRLPRPVHQMIDHLVSRQHRHPVVQIFPQQKLVERKLRQPNLPMHFPPGHLLHRLTKQPQNFRHIHPRLVLRRRIHPRNLQLEIPPQKLQQRHVHDRVLVVTLQRETLLHRLPLQPHRNQQNRRAKRPLALLRLLPLQKSERQIQRVRPALLHLQPRPPIQIQQTPRQLRLRQRTPQPPRPHLLRQMRRHRIFPLRARPQREIPRIESRHQPALLLDRKTPLLRQLVFQLIRIRANQRNRLLRFPKIQQPVPQRQIQQLLLPMIDPVSLAAHFRRHLRLLPKFPRRDPIRRNRRHRNLRPRRVRQIHRRLSPPQRQRPNPRRPRPKHIDRIPKNLVAPQMRTRRPHRRFETGTVSLANQRRLKQQNLVQLHPLPDALQIVHRRLRETLLHQPATRVSVPLVHQNQRPQTRLLQNRREQQTKIQTSRQPRFPNPFRKTHPLPRRLETRRRIAVTNPHLPHRLKRARRDFVHPLFALRLIPVKRALPRSLFQQIRRPPQQPLHRRHIRRHKRRQNFRQRNQSRPFIKRENLHRPRLRENRFPPRRELRRNLQPDFPPNPLRKRRQIIQIQPQRKIRQHVIRLPRNHRNPLLQILRPTRIRRNPANDLPQIRVRNIPNLQPPDHRNPVLLKREIHPRREIQFHLNRRNSSSFIGHAIQ